MCHEDLLQVNSLRSDCSADDALGCSQCDYSLGVNFLGWSCVKRQLETTLWASLIRPVQQYMSNTVSRPQEVDCPCVWLQAAQCALSLQHVLSEDPVEHRTWCKQASVFASKHLFKPNENNKSQQ